MKETTEKKKRKNPLLPVLVILSVCTLCALLLCVLLTVKDLQSENGGFSFFEKKEKKSEVAVAEFDLEEPVPVTYSEEEVNLMVGEAWMQGGNEREAEIKSMIRAEAESNAPSMANLLRKMFTECFVFPGDGRFYFVDINPAYPLNTRQAANYVTEDNGYRYYVDNGEKQTMLCIDVSSHQGAVDWPKAAESGVEAAMIRAGYRGYGSGKMVEDEQVSGNIQGALANNLLTGIYYFSQAINEEEIDEEVQVLLDLANAYGINGPLAIDVEKLDADTARANALTKDERTALIKHFCEKVKAAGYEPMIYGNGYSLFGMMNYEEIAEYPIWYAYYSDTLYFPYEPAVWQYSSTGKVNGINADVDLNVMYRKRNREAEG